MLQKNVIASGLLLLLSLALPTVLEAREFPTPKAEHQLMADEVGIWDAEVSVWPGPGIPVSKSTGKETCEMLGDFWMISKFEGNFGGQPFTGIAQTGYEPTTERYVSTWIDSLSPYVLTSRGEYDVATATLTLTGESFDWMTNKPKQFRMTTTYKDTDHKQFEIYEAAKGSDEWRKSMQIDYVRRE